MSRVAYTHAHKSYLESSLDDLFVRRSYKYRGVESERGGKKKCLADDINAPLLPSPPFNRARGALCAEQTLALHCASYYTFLETHPAHANLIEYRFYNNWRNCENQLTTSCPRMLHSVSVAVVPPFTGSCSTVLRRFCIWNR